MLLDSLQEERERANHKCKIQLFIAEMEEKLFTGWSLPRTDRAVAPAVRKINP